MLAADAERAPLTDRGIKAAGPDTVEGRLITLVDELVPGLELRISYGGTKSWALRYVVHGRRKRWTMGTYPSLSLAAARKLALDAQAFIATTQIDPATLPVLGGRKLTTAMAALGAQALDPATAKVAARQEKTVADLAAKWIEHVGNEGRPEVRARKRSWKQDRGVLDRIVLPAWRDRPVASITRADVRELFATVGAGRHRVGTRRRPAKPALVMANRVVALLSAMFNYAFDELEWVEANPAARMGRKMHKERSRERVLTDAEIRALWAACETAKTVPAPVIDPMIARGLQVLVLSAQRPGEVFGMKWEDVSIETVRPAQDGQPAIETAWWTIPEDVAKNGVAHRVWLVPRAVALLRDAEQHYAEAIAAAAARDRTLPDNPYVFASLPRASVADDSAGPRRRAQRRRYGSSAPPARSVRHARHDARRTAATNMRAAGVPREHVSYVLNHLRDAKTPEATRVYDR